MVLEVMGRHAGWVALYTAIASAADYVCIPEKKIDTAEMLKKLRAAHARKRFALVVTSEAAELPEAGEAGSKHEVDQFGHSILKDRGIGEHIARFVEKNTGIETRHAVIGHMQRGGAPTLFDRMLATRVGMKAADLVHAGQFGMMSALVGNKIEGVPLEKATGQLKTVSKEWFEMMEVLF
jgi:6-phosphofructokinase 1